MGRGSITAELRRRGWTINRKRVQRIMRVDNFLCLRRMQARAHDRFQPRAGFVYA